MKKVILLSALLALLLSACIPGILQQQQPAEAPPPADLQATVAVIASTQSAQTLASLPTPTLAMPTNTAVIAPTSTGTPTPEPATATPTSTPDGTDTVLTPTETTGTPGITATVAMTGTASTPDDVTPTMTFTGTPPSATPTVISVTPSATATSPISINPPPASVPRFKVKVINKSGVRIYISLQGTTEGGYHPIIEYDILRKQKVTFKAPKGFYTVVVWVGADPMVDYVNISGDITIRVQKNSFSIEK